MSKEFPVKVVHFPSKDKEAVTETACGRGHACSFCPEENHCQRDKPAHNKHLIEDRLSGFGWIILVMANKGGVGKSTVAANLAVSLAGHDYRVGLADADIHGPNAPRIFGLQEERVKVTPAGITTAQYQFAGDEKSVQLGSLGFFLSEADTPVVWRDAYKHDYIHHMIGSFNWGPLDFLVVDMPPGTGNELITLTDMLEDYNVQALLVSSADAIALQDTLKAGRFCRERGLPIMGLVENYAGSVCPHCNVEIELFPRAKEIGFFEQAGIETLTRLPFSSDIATAAATGKPAACDSESLTGRLFKPVVDVCRVLLQESSEVELRQGLADILETPETLATEDPEVQAQLQQMLSSERKKLSSLSSEN